MTALASPPQPRPTAGPMVSEDRHPTIEWALYLAALDLLVRALNTNAFGPFTAAANDAAAAAAGVPIGTVYQNSGTLRVRLS